MAAPRYIAIANPHGKRWQAYAQDLTAFWHAHGTSVEIEVVPWSEIVLRDGNLDGLPAFARPAVVRLESPGRDFDVTKLLLRAGSREDPAAATTDWLSLLYRKGLLLHPALVHRGFCRVLGGLRQAFDVRPHLQPLSCPLAVAKVFDKNKTQARLEHAGIPCPTLLPTPANPEELVYDLRARRIPIAYVKLATGSSASGIAVVHALDNEPWAITSVVRIDGEFFNTRRLQRYTGDDLAAVLRFLLTEGTCIQQGIPMAQIDGQNFDVRVVVIHGRPVFTIFRLSPAPMTNLHLGGRRGQFDACRSVIPTRAWLDAMDHCVAAASLFPCTTVGIDLLFERGFLRHFILEVNAFGDWFPGLVDEMGKSVHGTEIEASARKWFASALGE